MYPEGEGCEHPGNGRGTVRKDLERVRCQGVHRARLLLPQCRSEFPSQSRSQRSHSTHTTHSFEGCPIWNTISQSRPEPGLSFGHLSGESECLARPGRVLNRPRGQLLRVERGKNGGSMRCRVQCSGFEGFWVWGQSDLRFRAERDLKFTVGEGRGRDLGD